MPLNTSIMSTPFAQNIQAARAQKAQTDKEQAEFKSMIAEMRRTQAAVMAGNGKSTVILTDQTDLGDKITELTDKTVDAIANLDIEGASKHEIDAINEVVSAIHSLENVVETYTTALDRQTVQIIAAIKKIELSPNITVKPAEVATTTTEVDLKPLEKAIRELKTKPVLNLSDYRAHDLDDSPDGKQYIGFVAAGGEWYILQSDDSTKSMRYYFGNGSYSEAWDERFAHDYSVLSEAIRVRS